MSARVNKAGRLFWTLDDTENDTDTETDNDNYGFHCNMQSPSHCAETLSLMPLATFSHFISLATYIVFGVAQCEHTINVIRLSWCLCVCRFWCKQHKILEGNSHKVSKSVYNQSCCPYYVLDSFKQIR